MSDLINRQDAIYALTEANLKNHMDSVEGGQENRSAIRIIMELPSADRKRGEWKFYSRDEDAFDVYGNESWAIRYYCSNCNFMHAFIENRTAQYNFCPNCGARMDERRKDAEKTD